MLMKFIFSWTHDCMSASNEKQYHTILRPQFRTKMRHQIIFYRVTILFESNQRATLKILTIFHLLIYFLSEIFLQTFPSIKLFQQSFSKDNMKPVLEHGQDAELTSPLLSVPHL